MVWKHKRDAQPCGHTKIHGLMRSEQVGCIAPGATQGWGGHYLVRQPPLQLVSLPGAELLLLAQRRLLLLHQALGGLQVGLPLPHGAAQRVPLCTQGVQP